MPFFYYQVSCPNSKVSLSRYPRPTFFFFFSSFSLVSFSGGNDGDDLGGGLLGSFVKEGEMGYAKLASIMEE